MSKLDELRGQNSNPTQSRSTKLDKLRTRVHNDRGAAEMDESRMINAGREDVADTVQPATTSEHPVQDWIADKTKSIMEKPSVQKVVQPVSNFINKVENLPVVKNIHGAMAGADNAPLKPQYDSFIDFKPGQAIDVIKSALQSGITGFKNPDEALQTQAQNNEEFTKDMGPVAKFAYNTAVGGATDPLSYIPIPVKPLASVLKKARGAAEGELLGALPKAASKPVEQVGTKLDQLRNSAAAPSLMNGETLSALPEAAAAESAPAMKGNWFTNLFGNQGVGISAIKSNKRIGEGPVSTLDQLVNKSTKTESDGLKESLAAMTRASYQNFVDHLSPLKKVSDTAYETAMDASRANNIANAIVRDKFVTPEGVVVGEGLENIFKKVARGQDKQFIDYLTLRHAKTRLERGERVYAEHLGMTPDKVQERITMYDKRHPGFAAIAKEWDGFNDNVLQQFGVKEGLISENMYKTLREQNPNYSPMRRQFSKSEKPGRNFLAKSTSSAFSGQKAPLQKVSPTGSVRDIVDPRRTTIESVGSWVNAAMRNRTMQSIVDAVRKNPESFHGVIELKPMKEEAKQASLKEMNQLIQEHGVEGMLEALNKDFELLFKKSPKQGLNEDNVVRAMVNGEPVHLQVHDPELVKTLIGMGPQASNLVMDVLSAMSNATKRGATGLLAPVFAVKGATMDLVQSAIQAKNPLQQAGYTVYAILSGIGDKLNVPGLKNLAEEYRRAGGEYSAALKGDRQVNKSIASMTREPLLSANGLAKGAWGAVKTPFKALEAIGDIAENAPRIAAYKGEMNRLGNVRSPENVRQAMSKAREITTNFSRKGAMSRDIEAFVPYNNAAVQGTYRVMKAFKDNPIRTTAAVATLAVIPKFYEYMQFHDDPDYRKLPARERSRFLFIDKNEDGTFTKIPMEPAYNSIGELTIEALRHYIDNDPTAFKDSADALVNAWLPPAISGPLQGLTQGSGIDGALAGAANSTVLSPLSAVLSNKSFTGVPIESAAVTDRSPQYRYDERTSGIAKQIGEWTGFSPMKTDYLIRAYGGDPARLLLPLTSKMGGGNLRDTVLKNFIVDPEFTNTLTNDFYGAKEKMSQAYRDNQEVGAALPSWYDDNLRKEITSTAKGSVSKKIKELTDTKKEISMDKTLTADQRTKRLREVQTQLNDIYLDINSKLYAKGVPTK